MLKVYPHVSCSIAYSLLVCLSPYILPILCSSFVLDSGLQSAPLDKPCSPRDPLLEVFGSEMGYVAPDFLLTRVTKVSS